MNVCATLSALLDDATMVEKVHVKIGLVADHLQADQ